NRTHCAAASHLVPVFRWSRSASQIGHPGRGAAIQTGPSSRFQACATGIGADVRIVREMCLGRFENRQGWTEPPPGYGSDVPELRRPQVSGDVVDLIMQDHREVERLFSELQSSPEKRPN